VIRGGQWIEAEDALDVREEQFLVLLFVVYAQHDGLKRCRFVDVFEERAHRAVDVCTIGERIVDGRSRQVPAICARKRLTYGVVVRVEQPFVHRGGTRCIRERAV
jgi:hypothetical protein